MGAFFSCFMGYIIKMCILVVVGFVGAKIGISIRKSKDLKTSTKSLEE